MAPVNLLPTFVTVVNEATDVVNEAEDTRSRQVESNQHADGIHDVRANQSEGVGDGFTAPRKQAGRGWG